MNTVDPFSTACLKLKPWALATSMILLVGLAACDKSSDGQTVGQKFDSVVTNAGQKATDAKTKAEASISTAGDAIKDATQKVEVSGSQAAISMANQVDDAAISASVAAGFAKDADLSAIKIDVDTRNGSVTLYGPAPSATAKDRATAIAKSIKGVTAVDNKLVVKV